MAFFGQGFLKNSPPSFRSESTIISVDSNYFAQNFICLVTHYVHREWDYIYIGNGIISTWEMGFDEHREWVFMYTGNGTLCTQGMGFYEHREWDSMYIENEIL